MIKISEKIEIYTCPACNRKFTKQESSIGHDKYKCPRCHVNLIKVDSGFDLK